ncbi:MAG TPA: glycosyltransferase [Polyangia bacterium]|jgi:Glycosyltransferases involved in cell wall biogenesis|nr:glycosyltransferase [Polyangia bacterium]
MTIRASLALSPLDPQPLVSVLMANYNYARYIGAAIESALRQSHDRLEVVVVDDGSTDDSCDIVKGYANRDARVRLFRKDNGGAGSALNRAFAESRGAIVCLLDADDLWAPGKLARVVAAFRDDPDSGLVTHPLEIIDGEGRRRGEFQCVEGGYLGDDIASLRVGHLMPVASGLSFRRAVLERIMPIPEERFRGSADLAIAYAASVLARTVRVPEFLASYRVHGANLTGTTLTAARFDAELLRKMVSSVERPVEFVDEFSREHRGVAVPVFRSRNVLEHRMMLALLTSDRPLVEQTRTYLRNAYREVRRDYPPLRYGLWMALSSLPAPLAGNALQGVVRAARLWGRLRSRISCG